MSFLGLMESPVDALWDLCHKILTMPAGSWFVDEFVMTNPEEHTKWAEDLQNLRYYMACHALDFNGWRYVGWP